MDFNTQQKTIINTPPGKIAVVAGAGCLSGETLVNFNRGKKGFYKSLSKAYLSFNNINPLPHSNWEKRIPTYVRSCTNDNIVKLHEIEGITYSGEKEVYQITLQNGCSLKGTGEHLIKTSEGWVSILNLSEDHLIACDSLKAYALNSKKEKRRDKIVRGLKHHPYAYRDKKNTFRIEEHRLVYESYINNLSLYELVYLLKWDKKKAQTLQYINPKQYEIHHKDHNHLNNAISNLLCIEKRTHRLIHTCYLSFHQGIIKYSPFKSREFVGFEKTYDITCKDPYHNFVANGIVVHNSGKTATTLALVEKLYLEDNLSLDRLFLTTYTNKAARDLKERLQKRLKINDSGIKRIWLGTFHSLGYRYLTQIKNLKLAIILPVEANHYLRNIYNQVSRTEGLEEDPKGSFSEIIQSIERKRNQNCTWEKVTPFPDICINILKMYQEEKKKQSLVDYTDILEIFAEHLKEDPYFRTKFDWIFCDEVQDSNHIQHELMELMASKNFVSVGDEKQAIYSFRGALPSLFKEKIKHVDYVYPLAYNYRSTPEIIDFANILLDQMPSFTGQSLIATKSPGPKPQFTLCEDIAKHIFIGIKKDISLGIPLHEIAVLGRSIKPVNIQNLQVLLRQANIPYTLRGGDDKLNATYIQNYLSVLKSICAPTKASLMNTLSLLPKVGAKTAMTLAERVLLEGFSSLSNAGKLCESKAFQDFLNLERFKNQKKDLLLRSLDFIHDHYLVPNYGKKDPKDPINKKKLIFDLLYGYLLDFPKISEGIDSLYINEEDADAEKGKIIISTIHASKGLEFESVHLANVNEFSIPFLNPEEEKDLERTEEEFCIMYVACTRAKKSLNMYTAFRTGSGEWSKNNKISRYISDLYKKFQERYFTFKILDVSNEIECKQRLLEPKGIYDRPQQRTDSKIFTGIR